MTTLLRRVGAVAAIAAQVALAGPNASAVVSVDLVPETPEIDSVGPIAGPDLTVAVRVTGARNLDSYEFVVSYDADVLGLVSAAKDDAGLPNLLESLGGDAMGFVTPTDSSIDVSYSLFGDQDSAQSPDGDGILAVVHFSVLAAARCTVSISAVRLIDYDMERDTIVGTSPAYLEPVTAVAGRFRTLRGESGPTVATFDPQGRFLDGTRRRAGLHGVGSTRIMVSGRRAFAPADR